MTQTEQDEWQWGAQLGVNHQWHRTEHGWESRCGHVADADCLWEDDPTFGRCAACATAAGEPLPARVFARKQSEPVPVPLGSIDPNPWQPRHGEDMTHVLRIAEDIKQNGLLQTPVARLVDAGGAPVLLGPEFDIAAALAAGARAQQAFGHTRLAAYRVLEQESAAYASMPLLFRELDNERMALMAWSENQQRKDLTAWEQAKAIQRAMQDFGWAQTEAADKMGLDRSTLANKLRLLKLPAEQQRQLHTGELSERTALALLPLIELPAPALQHLDSADSWNKPSQIIKSAASNNSDSVRSAVGNAIANGTLLLTRVPFIEIDLQLADVQSPTCTSCPIRVKHQSGLRCPDRNCFRLKAATYQERILAAASAESGIVSGNCSTNDVWGECEDFWGNGHKTHLEDILKKGGCEQLRLVFQEENRGVRPIVDGHPHAAIVCHHGKRRSCTCIKSREVEQDRAAAQQQQAQRTEAESILKPALPAILDAIQTGHVKVWRRIASHMGLHVPDASGTDEIQQRIARYILERSIPVDALQKPESARTGMDGIVRWLGVEIGTPEDVCAQTLPDEHPAAALERQLRRFEGWIVRSSTERQPLAAIQGNRTNLQRLQDELAQLSSNSTLDDGTYEDLYQRIDAALEALEALDVPQQDAVEGAS